MKRPRPNFAADALAKILALAGPDGVRGVNLPRAVPRDEAEFQGQVVDLAEGLGFRVYHTLDSRGSQSGFPDLVLAGHRRLFFAELKTERGRTSAEQLGWLEAIRAAGVPAHLWRPGDWPEIEVVLTGAARA